MPRFLPKTIGFYFTELSIHLRCMCENRSIFAVNTAFDSFLTSQCGANLHV